MPPIPKKPTTPASLTVTASPTANSLLWNVSTDNVGVTGYKVFRNGVQIATGITVPGNQTNVGYYDYSIVSFTNYTYTVQAYDAAGNSSLNSNAVTIKTGDVQPPNAPTDVATTVTSSTTKTSVVKVNLDCRYR